MSGPIEETIHFTPPARDASGKLRYFVKNCKLCKKTFLPNSSGQLYCTTYCRITNTREWRKKYMKKYRKNRNNKNRNYEKEREKTKNFQKIKNTLPKIKCPNCNYKWIYRGEKKKLINILCPNCYLNVHQDKSYHNLYYIKNRKRLLEKNKQYRLQLKIEVFKIVSIGTMKCTYCGCNNINVLEINHMDGGGRKERQNPLLQWERFYKAIKSGHYSINRLELTCIPCNAIHRAKMKDSTVNWKIKFQPSSKSCRTKY